MGRFKRKKLYMRDLKKDRKNEGRMVITHKSNSTNYVIESIAVVLAADSPRE